MTPAEARGEREIEVRHDGRQGGGSGVVLGAKIRMCGWGGVGRGRS